MKRSAIIAQDEWKRYGTMIPACLAGVALVGVPGYTLGVMIGPLEQEFGWSRSEISVAALMPAIAAVFLAPVVGMAVDRFGPRRIALFGVPFFSCALALLSTASGSIVGWWALYALLGFSTLFVFPTVWTAAINARFNRNRGAALAIALTGTGVAAAILPLLTTQLLESLGWRGAYVSLALLCFAITFPLVYLAFERHEVMPRLEFRTTLARTRLPPEFTSPRFMKLALGALLFSTGSCMLTVNAVPILIGEGFTLSLAAKIAGFVGIGTITGRLIGGFLLDQFDGRFVVAFSAMGPILGALLLLSTDSSYAAAALACFVLGVGGGAEYDACAYLTARHFGMRNFGSLFGLIGGLSVLGAGLAPAIANATYDLTQSYDAVLWAMIPGFVLTSALFLSIGPYPDPLSYEVPESPDHARANNSIG